MICVNKRTKKIKLILCFKFELFIIGTFRPIAPVSLGFKLFMTTPLLFTNALIPLLADLIKNTLLSTALKMDLAKCWCGPIEFPNQASSEIFTIIFLDIFFPSSGNIIS